MHRGDKKSKLKLKTASRQRVTGRKTKTHSASKSAPNLELATESKDKAVSTTKSLKKRDMDIEQIERSFDEGHIDALLREIIESWDVKNRRVTGVKPKVKKYGDLEKTSLFGAEDYEYKKFPEEDLSVERNAVVNRNKNSKPWVKRDYGTTDLRSKICESKRSTNFKPGNCSNSIETSDLLDPEENFELPQKIAEYVRETADLCSLVIKVVEDGIDMAQKYVEITTNRAKQKGKKNSRCQFNADEYRRVLLIASEKAKCAKAKAQHAYSAAKYTDKAANAFSKVLEKESSDVKISHYLMNWAKSLAYAAKVDTYKAAFASLKAIRKCFREMDDSRNMVPGRDRYLKDLAKSKKRNRCINVVLILAFIIGCVTVVLYNVFKPGNNAYYYIYYIGFALIACSAIVGFCRTLPSCRDENLALEDERQRTIREVNEHLRLIDEFFKTHNIIPDHSE